MARSKLKPISIRLRPLDITRARREGARRAMPYQTVLRGWIAEKGDETERTREFASSSRISDT